jgi:hypothetical protein
VSSSHPSPDLFVGLRSGVGLVLFAGLALGAPSILGTHGAGAVACAFLALILFALGVAIAVQEMGKLAGSPALNHLGSFLLAAIPGGVLLDLTQRGSLPGWAETAGRWGTLVCLFLAAIFAAYLVADLPAALARSRSTEAARKAREDAPGARVERRANTVVAFCTVIAAVVGLITALLNLVPGR